MSEPRPDQGQGNGAPPNVTPGELATDLFPGSGGPAPDDSPTIISKTPPQPARLDEALAGSLRGRNLAHFELIEPIGVGGMAAVIRARDLQLDRSVALKILPPEMAGDPENVRRFHQEARAAARLDHENIARVFFCGEDQRLHFIAFEFVEGENLRTLLERRGRLPVPEAIHYMLQVATGLAHASARGVVHRDIKPSNIIISPNGRAKLVDMGLARSREPHAEDGLTQSGVTLGTFDYISPEQALEPRDADVRSDIYSLGCTFYHMLTGQPPVPEGTAARKLHHHQHVAPLDPRQLNPHIPDDVAAILGRMMAKDPADRYQRAEHLVQHLLQVAQKLGAVNESPDGVLFVDAPLPEPPRRRPALMAALAVTALAALIAFLSLAPTDPGPVVWSDEAQGHLDEGPPDKDQVPAGDPKTNLNSPRRRDTEEIRSPSDLVKALTRRPAARRILLVNDLNLTLGKGGTLAGRLLFRPGLGQQRLVIASKVASAPCTIQLTFADQAEGNPGPGLPVEGQVTFRDVRFVVNGRFAARAGRKLAALTLSRGDLTLERCSFIQANYSPPSDVTDPPLPVAMVAAGGTGPNPPKVNLQECYFARGQRAVLLTGPATVWATNCAFGRHRMLFQIAGTTKGNTEIRLRNCSALVVDGPVFKLDDDAGCSLFVSESVFSRPEGNSECDLIQQTDGKDPGRLVYKGRRNCYHNLNSFWKREAVTLYKWVDFSQALARLSPPTQDSGSSELDPQRSPWQKKDPLSEADPQRAFRLKTNLEQLRSRSGRDMIGVVEGLRGPLYDRPLPPLAEKSRPVVRKGPKVKVVSPGAKNPGEGVYTSLEGALGDAETGDEIQIKSNGVVKIKNPVQLNKAATLTIKPYPDFHPVITLEDDNPDPRASLFRLHDVQVKFERLEFRLKPKAEVKFQSVCTITGNGVCDFRQCVLTLIEPDKPADEKRLSVVRLTDPGEAMKMATPSMRTAPAMSFRNCLVRGQGDLVAVGPSRPLELEVANSLVALDGSLLYVDGITKEPPASATNSGSTNQVVKLTNVTAYLGEHLVHLRAKNVKGLVPTQVKNPAHCLFVAARNKPLIQIEGLDQKQMSRLFLWEVGKGNAYLMYHKLLYSKESSYDQAAWQDSGNDNVKDEGPRFPKNKFKLERPAAEAEATDFAGVKLDDLSSMEVQKYGADLDRLPRPAAPKESDSAEEKPKDEEE
jgi:serine/threonine protein kinase